MLQGVHVVRPVRLAVFVCACVAALAGCEKSQLVAPTKATITISTPVRFLPAGGSAEVSAFVIEEAGTPVQNGTLVRFSATLGRVDPVQALTRNGVAVTTFVASNSSGTARIVASSGAASGGEGNSNAVEIVVGAAAVNTVTIRANPGAIGPSGGTVQLIATVVGENGQALEGIGVTFNTDQGTLSAANVTTNSSGEARTNLTTSQQTVVSATAGTKTSSNVTIAIRSGPVVTIACTPTSGTVNCSAVATSTSTNTATVLFTITKASGSSALRTATIDFGDSTSQDLGNLAGGSATVTHTYSGPSSTGTKSYIATVLATDINGESASVSNTVVISRVALTPISVTIAAEKATATTVGQRWTFTATATGGGDGGTGNAAIESYTWGFGDGSAGVTTSGNTTAHIYDTETNPVAYVVTVEVRTPDGRTATARTEILVDDNTP